MSIKEERAKKGLTQKELSEKSGVNLRMVQKYEQGAKDINKVLPATLYKLALALGVPTYRIVTDKQLIKLIKKERRLK